MNENKFYSACDEASHIDSQHCMLDPQENRPTVEKYKTLQTAIFLK
jgi:hypothetical protein